MVFGLTPSLYVKAGSAIFGVYGVQMLVMPSTMMTDHFHAPSTKYTDFWIRGHAATVATVVYCMQQMESEAAAKAMLGLSAAIALLYPFNAKFGYLSQLEVKCARRPPTALHGLRHHQLTLVRIADPMHYVPEALMLGLTVAGICALKK